MLYILTLLYFKMFPVKPNMLLLGFGPIFQTLPNTRHNIAKFLRNSLFEFPASTSKEHPKRDENSSFSFKHFLRYDVNNYQNLGARPKVYCDGRPITSISDLDLHQITMGKQTRMVPEFSSALPDFVQDHLVMEQSYLGKDLTNSYSLDLPNLPDFTPSQTSSTINRLNMYTSHADCRDDSVNRRDETGNRRDDRHPTVDFPARPQPGFPLDLPISDPQPTTSRSCPPTAEVRFGISHLNGSLQFL